jgi:PIN domain nuclease of toxin-antitoxin system
VILLDTHVLIWLVEDDPSLATPVAAAIDLSGERHEVLVSAISFWEIGTLISKRRLELSLPLRDWTAQALSQPGFVCVDLTPRTAIESSLLPQGLHADPADRLLVATARDLDATLVTHDRRILRYGELGHVKVMAA